MRAKSHELTITTIDNARTRRGAAFASRERPTRGMGLRRVMGNPRTSGSSLARVYKGGYHRRTRLASLAVPLSAHKDDVAV
jgi:hypothetical protein